jgi:TatD DNase family protein
MPQYLNATMSHFLIDTHAHLYSDSFDEDRKEMIQRALDNNIQHFFLPNIDEASIPGMLELEAAYPGRCHAMMGLHPCSVKADYKTVLNKMYKYLGERKFCAVGEIGLDYYWSKEFIAEQKDAFRIQCAWSKDLEVPIVIHARDSIDDLIQLVKEEQKGNMSGIFHCFTGTLEQANQIIDLGFKLGLGGVLTFKNAKLDRVIEHVDLEHLVLETDAPYLTPHPHRGKRNESAYVKLVAEKLADIKQTGMEQIARATSENALKLFGLN